MDLDQHQHEKEKQSHKVAGCTYEPVLKWAKNDAMVAQKRKYIKLILQDLPVKGKMILGAPL